MKRLLRKIKESISFPKTKLNIDGWNGSALYWEMRYQSGGNSGAGSYGRLAEFKAEILNKFVKEHDIKSIIEWGCGDGRQLQLADYPKYVGYDVSKKSIQMCIELFEDDITKSFIYCGGEDFKSNQKAELSLSLDVIYHLVEDSVFNTYMHRLFSSSTKYVCIYSCNDEDTIEANHVKHRRFTDWIEMNITEWKLIKYIPNKYPYNPMEAESSWSDFYFYKKCID